MGIPNTSLLSVAISHPARATTRGNLRSCHDATRRAPVVRRGLRGNQACAGSPVSRSAANDRVEAELCDARRWLPLSRRWGSLGEAAALGRRQPCNEGGVSYGIAGGTFTTEATAPYRPATPSQMPNLHAGRMSRPAARLIAPADPKRLVVVARRQRRDDEMPVDRAVRAGITHEMTVNREALRRPAARNDIRSGSLEASIVDV
jgi:hypothetical protein